MAKRNKGSVISTVTKPWDGKIWTANTSRNKTVLSPKRQDWLWNQTASDSTGGRRDGPILDVNLSSPSNI